MLVLPTRHEVIAVDIAVSADNLRVSISVEGNDLTNVFMNDIIPRNTFTTYLSSSILSVVAAYGPWTAGYGLPPLALQTTVPTTEFQVGTADARFSVRLSTRILNKAPKAFFSSDL